MDELSEIYLEASGGKYGDQKGIFAVRDHVEAEMKAKLDRAERALKRAGYQDLGAQEWKPPLGKAPRFDLTEQAIRNAWLDAEVVGNSWDGAKAVLDLINEKEISTGKAFQMEPVEPGTMSQDKALDTVISHVIGLPLGDMEPPTDQVEALARVLHKEANQNGNFPKPDFEKVPAIEKDRLLLLARAEGGRMSIDNKISRYKKLRMALETMDSKPISFLARESDDMSIADGRHTQFEMRDISDSLKSAIKEEVMNELAALRKDICDSAHSVFVCYSAISQRGES